MQRSEIPRTQGFMMKHVRAGRGLREYRVQWYPYLGEHQNKLEVFLNKISLPKIQKVRISNVIP